MKAFSRLGNEPHADRFRDGGAELHLYFNQDPSPGDSLALRAGAVDTVRSDFAVSESMAEDYGIPHRFTLLARVPGGRLIELTGSFGGACFATVLSFAEHSRIFVGLCGAQVVVDYSAGLRVDRFGEDCMVHYFELAEPLLLMKTELAVVAYDVSSLRCLWRYEPAFGAPFSIEVDRERGIVSGYEDIDGGLLERFDLRFGPAVER